MAPLKDKLKMTHYEHKLFEKPACGAEPPFWVTRAPGLVTCPSCLALLPKASTT